MTDAMSDDELFAVLQNLMTEEGMKAALQSPKKGGGTEAIINFASVNNYPRVGKSDRDGQILTDGTVYSMTRRLVKT